MSATYVDAPEVLEIVQEVIQTVEDHADLLEGRAKFRCLFRSGRWESKGRPVLAKVTKASEQLRYLADDCDYLLVVNGWMWGDLTDRQRRALIDHELCHCAWARDSHGLKKTENNRPVWTTVGHDLEEFAAVVQRHGLWDASLRAFMRKAKEAIQRSLFDAPAGASPAERVAEALDGKTIAMPNGTVATIHAVRPKGAKAG